jgi:sugar phosphate isomerase/epimerase
VRRFLDQDLGVEEIIIESYGWAYMRRNDGKAGPNPLTWWKGSRDSLVECLDFDEEEGAEDTLDGSPDHRFRG